MNPNVRIVNTAPPIFLSKIGKLELLRIGEEVIYVPVTVLSELRAIQDEATRAVQAILGTWLLEKACSQPNLMALAVQALDLGEAEVVALALELGTKDTHSSSRLPAGPPANRPRAPGQPITAPVRDPPPAAIAP